MLFANLALGTNNQGVEPAPACRFDSRRIGFVGNHDCDVCVEFARGDVVGDCLEVGTASGEQDAKVLHGFWKN